MLDIGLIDTEHMQSVIKVFSFLSFLFLQNCIILVIWKPVTAKPRVKNHLSFISDQRGYVTILKDFQQGFQLLGIAWREKHQVRSARTHEWGPGPPIGPLRGPGRKPLTGVQGSAPLCRKILVR